MVGDDADVDDVEKDVASTSAVRSCTDYAEHKPVEKVGSSGTIVAVA